MSEVVGIDAKRHLHRRKHIPLIHVLHRRNRPCERRVVDAVLAGIEAADSLLDFFQPLLLGRVVRLDQPDTLAANERQIPADAAVRDRGVDGLLGGRRDPMRRHVVTVDAVHDPPLAFGDLLVGGSLGLVLLDLAVLADQPHVGDLLPLVIRGDELDADVGIGMPVNRPAARCRPARPTNEHLQDRRCFRVGVVVRVLPLDLDDVAGIAARPVTVAAGLERRTHVGDTRDRFGDLVGDHVIQLPRAGELGAHERLRAFTDVTRGARDFRVRRRLPGGELRVHRQMTRLAAECRRIHLVHRALAGEQDDDDVDGGQRDDGQYRSARRRLAEIEDRPVACGLWMVLESPALPATSRAG